MRNDHLIMQRLSDGFASDPLPVGAATDAHTVIAQGFDAPMPHRVNAPSRLLAQITATRTNNLMHARLAAVEASSMRLLRVFPKLERRICLFDTHAMSYLIEAGRRATEAMLPSIMSHTEATPLTAALCPAEVRHLMARRTSGYTS